MDFKKCKSMLISKNSENVINNDFQVDNWKVDYVDNKTTGVADLTEYYDGKIRIEKAAEYTCKSILARERTWLTFDS